MKDGDKSKAQLIAELQGLNQELESARNDAEQKDRQLMEKQLILDAILDNTPVLISIKDSTGKVLMVSRNFSKLKGPSPEEFVGKNIYDLFPFEVADALWKNDQKAFYSQSPIEAEEVVQHSDDSWHTYLTCKFPLYSPSGELFGVCAISTDITNRKVLEQQVYQSQKMKSIGILASGIAHDFNNILGAIIANTELLSSLCVERQDKVSMGYVSNINKSGKRAAELIKQMLIYSRMRPAKAKLVDLVEVVYKSLSLIRTGLPRSIVIEEAFEQDCPKVLADKTQVEQMLMNLCSNACHAYEGGLGKIYISIQMQNIDGIQQLVLSVRDEGKGMSRRETEHIFDPFFTTKEVGVGTGLGMSVVQGIVAGHDAKIKVQSEQGAGTCISIFFNVQ